MPRKRLSKTDAKHLADIKQRLHVQQAILSSPPFGALLEQIRKTAPQSIQHLDDLDWLITRLEETLE
jgi:hypothetical protein